METELVRDDRDPETNATLLQALQRLSAPSGTQNSMTFGVEDAEGRVYRIVRSSGVCETVRIFETARELGFDIGNPRFATAANLQKVLRRRRIAASVRGEPVAWQLICHTKIHGAGVAGAHQPSR